MRSSNIYFIDCNYRHTSTSQPTTWMSEAKQTLTSLTVLAIIFVLPLQLKAQCNPAFPKTYEFKMGQTNAAILPLDVDGDGATDFEVRLEATPVGKDYNWKLFLSPFGDTQNSFIVNEDEVAQLDRGANIPGAGPFLKHISGTEKLLYESSKDDCRGLCKGNAHIGIVMGKGHYGFLELSADISSINSPSLTIHAGGVHPTIGKIVTPKCISLPNKLPSFQTRVQGQEVIVAWSNPKEEIRSMEVQRSTDGNYFETINWINSSEAKAKNKHIFRDTEAIPNQQYYYRIKQVYPNGRLQYSTALLVDIQKQATPTIGEFILNASATIATASIIANKPAEAILTLMRKGADPVLNMKLPLQVGENKAEIPLKGLQKGVYFIKVELNNKRSYRKLELL